MLLKSVKRELIRDFLFDEYSKKILRIPLGIPIFRNEKTGIFLLKVMIEDFKPKLLISIGDIVSYNLVVLGHVVPDLAIIDYKTRRKKRETPILEHFDVLLKLGNPPSHITKSSWFTISKGLETALKGRKVIIVVDGEEDLLAIPSLLLSPDRSFIVYGQPGAALVVIISNKYVKSAFSEFLLERNTRIESCRKI